MKSSKLLFLFLLISCKAISQDLIPTEHPYLYLLNDENYSLKFEYKVNPNGYKLKVYNDSILILSNIKPASNSIVDKFGTYEIKVYKNRKLLGEYRNNAVGYEVKNRWNKTDKIPLVIEDAELVDSFLYIPLREFSSSDLLVAIKLNIYNGATSKLYLPQGIIPIPEDSFNDYFPNKGIKVDPITNKLFLLNRTTLIEYSLSSKTFKANIIDWTKLLYAKDGLLYFEAGSKVKCADANNLKQDFKLYSQGKYYSTKALLPYNNTIFFQSSDSEKYHYFKIVDKESQKVNRSEAIPFNYTDMYADKTQVGIFTDLESRAIFKQIKMPYESHIQLTDGYFQIVAINKKVKSKNKSILGADYEETKETESSPSTIVYNFSQTCNVYRTFKTGEMRGDFKELKWQVKFISGRNTIDQYWEKDGFPATSFKLYETFNVIESKKTEDYKYVYLINKTKAIFFNSKAPTTVTITTDGGNTFTEYATYDSYNKQFK